MDIIQEGYLASHYLFKFSADIPASEPIKR